MKPDTLQELEKIKAQIDALAQVKMPFYCANKIVDILDELDLVIKFLKISG